MPRAWAHKACASHFRHARFSKRLCVTTQGQMEAESFAGEIALAMTNGRPKRPAPTGKAPAQDEVYQSRGRWPSAPFVSTLLIVAECCRGLTATEAQEHQAATRHFGDLRTYAGQHLMAGQHKEKVTA
jgi:hypothetical protein